MILIYQKIGYMPCEVFGSQKEMTEYIQEQDFKYQIQSNLANQKSTTITSSGLPGCFITEDLTEAKKKLQEMQTRYPDRKLVLGTYTQQIEVEE